MSRYCFPLNGNEAEPAITGFNNVMLAYRKTLPNIEFLGEPLFAPVLEKFKDYVVAANDSPAGAEAYKVLVLLTSGSINDMTETKNLLVELSTYPCSVIIIGVGKADFSGMEELDGDNVLLCNEEGKPVERDIVQFVAFNEAMKWGNLEELVLKEIPD